VFENTPVELDISFARRKVQPPTIAYVAPGAGLQLRLWNSLASLQVSVDARVLIPSGQIQRCTWTAIPTSDRVRNDVNLPLPAGFLLSVVVRSSTGTPKRGQCFVRLSLIIGDGAAAQTQQLMLSDYLTETAGLGWPGGRLMASVEQAGNLRYVVGTLPAVNSTISETVPAGARWRLLSLFCTLTYAGAGGKWAWISFTDSGGNTIGKYVVSAPPTSLGVANPYTFGTGGGTYQGAPASLQFQVVSLPGGLFVPAGGTITVQTTPGLGGGDQFSAPVYAVEEWIE
jgi:hypothetical protein